MTSDRRCNCQLCRRHRRFSYVLRIVRRSDDIAAEWLEGFYDHVLDVEQDLEGYEHG